MEEIQNKSSKNKFADKFLMNRKIELLTKTGPTGHFFFNFLKIRRILKFFDPFFQTEKCLQMLKINPFLIDFGFGQFWMKRHKFTDIMFFQKKKQIFIDLTIFLKKFRDFFDKNSRFFFVKNGDFQ